MGGVVAKGRDMLAMGEKPLSGAPRRHVIVPPCRHRDFCIRVGLNMPVLIGHRKPQAIFSGMLMKPGKIALNVGRVPLPVMRAPRTRNHVSTAIRAGKYLRLAVRRSISAEN